MWANCCVRTHAGFQRSVLPLDGSIPPHRSLASILPTPPLSTKAMQSSSLVNDHQKHINVSSPPVCLNLEEGRRSTITFVNWTDSVRGNECYENSMDLSVLLGLSQSNPDIQLMEGRRQWRSGAAGDAAHWPGRADQEC